VANPEIEELSKRASQLRSLADHIAGLADAPRAFSSTTMKNWAGPHADDVRGDLKKWHTKCENVAEALRDEARDCDKSAKDLKHPKS